MFRTNFVFVVLALFLVIAIADKVELYSDKYDYVNVDEILANDRLRDQYYKCFMDTGPCLTPDAKFFKGNFPEAIATKCKKCTEKQKQMFDKLADWYTSNRTEEWEALVAKFLEDVKKRGISS
ncbi:ejaculatory bulb-specific protein 3 [Orussus abietinus]|uniref:ejaculatory bulb-specific protein 3 n=1 Tax=Orussus abietinus TaxID=222816 RepID=UPI0006263C63|nr:ejaculatory bulb-specific protein 3 [Orussus abietinus]